MNLELDHDGKRPIFKDMLILNNFFILSVDPIFILVFYGTKPERTGTRYRMK